MKLIRNLILFATAFLSLLAPFADQVIRGNNAQGEMIVYVGTYTRQKSKGIYAYRFKPDTGSVTPIGLVAETVNPSFLAIHPNRRFLYAVNEVNNYEGQSAGSVSSFSLDPKSGQARFLNKVSSRGADPCHISVDQTGRWLLVANYSGGSVATIPIKEDGSLGEASTFVQHTGSSVNPQRQRGPHAHSVNFSPDNRFAIASDLGLDQVLVYRFDATQGTLKPNDPPFAKVKPGAGPRHFAFHPSGRFGYEINEIGSTVTAFTYQRERGILEEMQTISTLPKDFSGNNSTAEIEVHPNGRFLYGSNRGHDSIAVFAIDSGKGTLTPLEQVPTQGKTPRNFAIDPTGTHLFAANQGSDNIVVFRIDQKTGKPSPTGNLIEVPSPVCVVFLQL
jgi:6-phosphogluconolactonase